MTKEEVIKIIREERKEEYLERVREIESSNYHMTSFDNINSRRTRLKHLREIYHMDKEDEMEAL